jgi:hypothetical protein
VGATPWRFKSSHPHTHSRRIRGPVVAQKLGQQRSRAPSEPGCRGPSTAGPDAGAQVPGIGARLPKLSTRRRLEQCTEPLRVSASLEHVALVVVAPHSGDGDRHALEIRKPPLLGGFLASPMRLLNRAPGEIERKNGRQCLNGPSSHVSNGNTGRRSCRLRFVLRTSVLRASRGNDG